MFDANLVKQLRNLCPCPSYSGCAAGDDCKLIAQAADEIIRLQSALSVSQAQGEELRAQNSAYLRVIQPRPISSAPRDGSQIVAWYEHHGFFTLSWIEGGWSDGMGDKHWSEPDGWLCLEDLIACAARNTPGHLRTNIATAAQDLVSLLRKTVGASPSSLVRIESTDDAVAEAVRSRLDALERALQSTSPTAVGRVIEALSKGCALYGTYKQTYAEITVVFATHDLAHECQSAIANAFPTNVAPDGKETT